MIISSQDTVVIVHIVAIAHTALAHPTILHRTHLTILHLVRHVQLGLQVLVRRVHPGQQVPRRARVKVPSPQGPPLACTQQRHLLHLIR